MFPVVTAGDHQVRMVHFTHSAAHSTSKLKTIISTLLFAKMIMFTKGWWGWRFRTWGRIIRTLCLTEHHFNRPQVGWSSSIRNTHQLPLWKAILNNSSTPLLFKHKTWSLVRYHGMKITHSPPAREIRDKCLRFHVNKVNIFPKHLMSSISGAPHLHSIDFTLFWGFSFANITQPNCFNVDYSAF